MEIKKSTLKKTSDEINKNLKPPWKKKLKINMHVAWVWKP